MARKTKYETHIKPYFKDIKKMINKGIPEKDIYNNLGVSKRYWIECKSNYSNFSNLFQTKEIVKEKIDKTILNYDMLPSYTDLAIRLIEKLEDASVTDILKIMKQLYPNHNQWLQLEYTKLEVQREANNKDISTLAKIELIGSLIDYGDSNNAD